MTDLQYYLLCSVLCFLSTIFIKSLFTKPSTNNPPSPPALPVIGHLHLLTSSLSQSLHKLSTKYGPLLLVRFGASRMLVVSSASMAAEIFKTHDLTFASRPSFAFADDLPYKNLGFFATPYGDYWRFMKKLCMTELLSPKQIERSRSIRQEEIARFLKKMMECAERKQRVDVGAELMRLTNNKNGDEAEKIRELVKESFELAAKVCFGDVLGPLKRVGFWVYGKQLIDVTMGYDRLLEGMLKQHEERAEREGWDREDKDLMDILLKAYQDDQAEVQITRTHVKAFLLDLFIGGTATTAEAMQWGVAELINHPDIFNKVREEMKTVVGSRLVEESDVANLPYLQAVIKETLRLHPPVPLSTRESRETCKIKEFDIPEKTSVAINQYAIMRDPELWDNPDEFRPERFLVSTKEKYESELDQNESRGHNFQYVPFGSGRRRCPGSNLATILLNTSIAAMVQCIDWKIGDGNEGRVNMEVGAGMSLPMAHPLVVLPVDHFNPFASSI
ncbi:putative beta-amyrin 24-hydroxylase [Rosa chinensis]|uniref:Putative beta-amyrin 24-hydroxylase n=1 Tax=Rosa chinensis TaxID=74649 RepID=A0A2P6S774_ROSCH|nr:putative beta-amyrin 24-hydroxylase [Rosa chinensis]